LERISVFVSSTISDLEGDRDAIVTALQSYDFVEVVGAKPIATPSMGNPYRVTRGLATNCDLYILVLGDRFGYDAASGKSATEVEFDAAAAVDPTKILVFRRTPFSPEDKQKAFADRVGSYKSGYWISDYRFTHELAALVRGAFVSWLKQRGGIGRHMTIFDRFVMLAVQAAPSPDARVEYTLDADDLAFTYHYGGATTRYEVRKTEIVRNFWECLYKLDRFVESLR
jgi:hypothetical protein